MAKDKTMKAITGKQLKALLAECRGYKNDMDEIAGNMGSAIKEAVDKKKLDKKMFNWVRQLDKMEPEKLAMHLANLDYYLDISGLIARAKTAPSFDDSVGANKDQNEQDADDDVAQDAAGDENVTRLHGRAH